MILADLLNKEGGLLTTGWYYTSELRVFFLQWFYRPWLLLFPNDWHMARVCAMATLYLVFAAAWLFLVRQAKLGQAGLWVAAAMMWPFGFWYFFLGTNGGYYLIHMLYLLVGLGLFLRLCTGCRSRVDQAVCLLLFGGTAAVAGLSSFRILISFYGPLLLAALLELLFAVRNRRPAAPHKRAVLLGGYAAAANLAGYLVNSTVLAKNHSFASYGGESWQLVPSLSNLLDAWSGLLSMLGFAGTSQLAEKPAGEKLFSFSGIATGLGLVMAFLFVVSVVRLLGRRSRLSPIGHFLLTVSLCGLGASSVVFCCIGQNQTQYWLPVLPYVFILFALELQTETFVLRYSRAAVTAGAALCLTICSINVTMLAIQKPLRGSYELYDAAKWLEEHNYTQGYASFWNSDAITEMTSGTIEMWTLYGVTSYAIQPWLQKTAHAEVLPDAEPVFLIIDTYTQEPFDMVFDGGDRVYVNGHYWIYEFESAQYMLDHIIVPETEEGGA